MLLALVIFRWQVDEPRFVREMEEESAKYDLDEAAPGESGDAATRKLSKGEFTSLLLILASVVFWFMGYNAVTSQKVDPDTGKTVKNELYSNYVVPARQHYAQQVTKNNPGTLVLFIGVLLIILIAMATFRSPAVALMPDVTMKPLRSKANAIINLMGTAGGVLVLILGSVFATGAVKNALMS